MVVVVVEGRREREGRGGEGGRLRVNRLGGNLNGEGEILYWKVVEKLKLKQQ